MCLICLIKWKKNGLIFKILNSAETDILSACFNVGAINPYYVYVALSTRASAFNDPIELPAVVEHGHDLSCHIEQLSTIIHRWEHCISKEPSACWEIKYASGWDTINSSSVCYPSLRNQQWMVKFILLFYQNKIFDSPPGSSREQ